MHNCIKTKEQILELLLDGTDQPRDSLLTELHACRECSAEFDALNATLRITSRVRDTATPPESYWTSYHAGLREKLQSAMDGPGWGGPGWDGPGWGGHGGPPLRSGLGALFVSSIRVPVPVVAAAVIVCVVLFSLSFGKSEPPIQAPSVVHVPVEIPVIQEKIVTRVVYKERRSQPKNPTRSSRNPNVENTFAQSQPVEPGLEGFKPAEDVKLVVIKGGSPYEK